MYSYVARQPIFNRQKHTIGYELLFRDGESNAFPNIEGNTATCRLLVENFMAAGNEPVNLGMRSFINFPHQSLVQLLPMLLPKQKVVIEILETCPPDDDLFLAVKHLYRLGYIIALDDCDMSSPWVRFLPYVHIIKIDVMSMSIDEAAEHIETYRNERLRFLAEKVETEQEFQAAKEAGFDLFQGYFFSRPEVIKKRKINSEKVSNLLLLREISRETVDFKRVETIIAGDVSLSYLLLRFVNTAATRTLMPISSFKQALVYLGERQLRLFIGAVATAHATLNKPKALYSLSLQRAKMCELLAQRLCKGDGEEQAFLTGMFSLLDAILDHQLAAIVDLLPLEPAIRKALVEREGILGQQLKLVMAFEDADWETVNQLREELGLTESYIYHCHRQAARWAISYQVPDDELPVEPTPPES